ncbi:reverse transcriptase domain-containing protein [Tanacetum coccineum]|uniref:Reverse transcriptase domain-containing protein n=1 Tax=Tanacetum coccineum TaxID=301880 RepID=A0ABQ4ZTC4_9ASTR
MDDQRTMAQLLEAPTAGYEDAIVVPEITADNFELKHGLLNLVQNKQFFGHDKEDPHAHIPRIWLEKEPPRSIQTWDDLVSKFINKFFPPSKTTNLRNEITRFQQRFDETFYEAWDRFNDLLRAWNFNQAPAYQPPVHQGQIYRPQVVQPPAYQAPAYQAPAPQIQGVSKEDFHSYVKANDAVMRNMQTQGQNMQNQLNNLATSNQRLESMLGNFIKMNTASTSGTLPSNTVTNPKEDLKGITTRSGVAYKGPTIPITSSSPKVMEREPEVTKDTMHPTNNGSTEDVPPPVVPVVYHESISEPANAPVSASRPNQKASIPFPSRRNDERRREKANDQIEKFYEIFRDLSFEISFTDALMLMPKFASTLKTLIGNKEKLSEMARTPLNENCSAVILNKLPKKLGDPGRFLIPCRTLIDVYEGEITLRVGREAITFNLDQTSRYTADYDHMTANRIDVIDMACEEYSQEVLGFSDVISSGNPTPFYDPIVSTTSPTLTPFGDSDYSPFSKKPTLFCFRVRSNFTRINEPPEVELKDLPPHLEYAFLEGDDKLPVIIAKDLKNEEKAALIEVLKSHKRAIAWKLSDIKGINPEFCTHKILMEEDYEPTVQHQRRVNPKIHDVIKKEVEKLLVSLNLLSRSRKLGHSTMELRSLIS